MKTRSLSIILTSLMMLFTANSFAEEQEENEGEEINMQELIGHHISNSHTWNIYGYKNDEGEEVSIDIHLPVIAYYEGQCLFANAADFLDGGTVEKDGNTYFFDHDKLYVRKPDGSEDKPLDLSITKNVCSMYMSVILLLLIFVGAARSYKKSEVPRGGTSLVEMLVLFVKDISDEQIGPKKSDRYTPYLLTLFYFIWINNLIGLVPFFPGGSNLSGNISFTAILAVFTFIITNVGGTSTYWKHNFTVPGVPVPMKLILVPIEIISMFIKPFTLMVRLFANVTGGHIIILSLISMIFIVQSYAMAVPSILLALMIFVLELIFGALQAYIFTLLSALYIGLALEEAHHE